MNYIAVCTPARDQVHTNYCYCLVNMVAYHTISTDDAISLKLMQGTILQNQRADLCLDAMAEGCSHILFIDSDMTFPQNMVGRLLAHDKDIVAANCARRRMPTGPTAQNYDENDKRIPVFTMPDSTGLEEVGSIGTGIMLIKRKVFEGMSEPWFDMPWQTTRGYMGEDVFFCRKARELGFKVYIDHDVSHEIGHIGTFEFGHPHTWIVKEEMEKEMQKEMEKEAKNGT